jgi:enamine deaminase RidA (YjgF/YER057c/UK114 family)
MPNGFTSCAAVRATPDRRLDNVTAIVTFMVAREATPPKQISNPPGVSTPQGYSHVLKKSDTPGFLAGQVALDAQGRVGRREDVAAQVEQVFHDL